MKKLFVILICVACSLQVAAQNKISLSLKNASLQTVLQEIKKQTGRDALYKYELLQNTAKVNIELRNASVEQALDACFKNQDLTYAIVGNTIVVKHKEQAKVIVDKLTNTDIQGRVTDQEGNPVEGATITIKQTGRSTATNAAGTFTLQGVGDTATLLITSIGYEPGQLSVHNRSSFNITLKQKISELDETVVIAYGTTTKRYNTGSVSKVSAETIGKQPVSNPLSALSGRVPGLVVTQSSGIAGASIKIQVRGQNSLVQGSDPLFVIDGVPFAPNNDFINQLSSAATPPNTTSGISPFNSINPSEIESIEVLKDADATAIYGSRGANGVVLITTKKGKSGKTRLAVNVYSGINRVTRTPAMLNTQQYLEMRREAFKNDGVIPTVTNAPDLLIWDTTRYTGFKDLLLGSTAHTTDAQLTISGGNSNTQFLVTGGYHHETAVFPGNFADKKSSARFSISHVAPSKDLAINMSAGYSSGNNGITSVDLASFINLPPNTPELYDGKGALNWQQGGVAFANPLSVLFQKYNARTGNLVSNLLVSYQLLHGLTVKASAGYNSLVLNEMRLYPKAAQNPAFTQVASANFATGTYSSWIIEPQAEYKVTLSKGKLVALIGSSLQQTVNNASSTTASGFSSDALIQSAGAATTVRGDNSYSQYRYQAFFGKLNYNWSDKYIVNITGRRDGSSRFGPGRQYAAFGAAGVAWLFSNEKFAKKQLPFITYGKLRGSYGSSGNDQIGNYKYLDSWNSTSNPYQGTAGLVPAQLFNPGYSWEVNRKLEGAVELGVLQNTLLINVAAYRNRSRNQLVSYKLPSQTGFISVIQNLPAVVQNAGCEVELTSHNIKSANFRWSTLLNISVQKNKLLEFPGIAASAYATQYVVGQPLSIIYGYRSLGVDPATGVYTFDDIDKSGTLNSRDYVVQGSADPVLYGGISNNIQYRGLQLDVFFEGRKQRGRNFLYNNFDVPGIMKNQPLTVLDRWQKPGDIAAVSQYTYNANSAAYKAFSTMALSKTGGRYSNASFIRLKNVYLSYNFQAASLKKLHAESCRLYLQAQNIATITGYTDGDPETQGTYAMPPLRTLTVGLQITF